MGHSPRAAARGRREPYVLPGLWGSYNGDVVRLSGIRVWLFILAVVYSRIPVDSYQVNWKYIKDKVCAIIFKISLTYSDHEENIGL